MIRQRQQSIDLYNRVKLWERMASARLLQDLVSRSDLPGLTPHLLHNWSIGTSPVYPHLVPIKRWFDWKQRQIWDIAYRLEKHFAGGF